MYLPVYRLSIFVAELMVLRASSRCAPHAIGDTVTHLVFGAVFGISLPLLKSLHFWPSP
jgi:hypothetical protein